MNGNTVLEYTIEETSPNCVRIHLSIQVGRTYSVEGGAPLIPRDLDVSSFNENELPDFLKESDFLRDIRSTEGVALVEVGPYSLDIHKGSLFEWDTIIPQVLAYISMHLNPNGEMKEAYPIDPVDLDKITASVIEQLKKEGKKSKSWTKKLRGLIRKS